VKSTTIIKNIQLDSSAGLAYFYFDTNNLTKQTVRGLIHSLVYSLFIQSVYKTALTDFCTACRNGHSEPNIHDLEKVLKELISGFRNVYIVIDALDECKELNLLLKFLIKLHVWQIPQCHILVTSRKEQDIVEALSSVASVIDLSKMPVNSDIMAYVDYVLEKEPELQKWQEAGKRMIKETLGKKANGM
jgi:hypothetical protein